MHERDILTSMKSKITTDKAPQATGAFSQAIMCGGFIFTGGQIHLTSDGVLITGTIEEKTRQVMENLKYILEAGGVSFKDVVKTTIYITDRAEYKAITDIYAEYIEDPYPARETVCVKELPLGASVEISMIATKHN